MMFRDFPWHTAWACAGKTGHGYRALIEYQPKSCGAQTGLLQILGEECLCEDEAQSIASNLLEDLSEITRDGALITRSAGHRQN